MSANAPQRGNVTDGRVARSERSRELIAAALYELVGEGFLEPTAEQVALRAGVGLRTVFRLFSDMDSLFGTVNERLMSELAPMIRAVPQEGEGLAVRAHALVDERVAIYERFAPYLRCTAELRSRSTYLEKRRRVDAGRLRARLLQWLPELCEARSELLEALDQATSFEAWDRLRSDQRLSRARSRAAMALTVDALAKTLQECPR